MRFEFLEDRRLMDSGPASGGARNRVSGRLGDASAVNPGAATSAERNLSFNMDAAAQSMAQALNLTPQAAQNLIQNILQIAQAAQTNNLQAAKERWDSVLRSLQTSIDANAAVGRSIEQTKAGFAGLATVVAEFAQSFGWTGFANSCRDLANRLQPKEVMPNVNPLQQLDPTNANPREFVTTALRNLKVDGNVAAQIADQAIDQTAGAARDASRGLNTVPTTGGSASRSASSLPGGQFLAQFNDAQLNQKFARALDMHQITQAQFNSVDADHNKQISRDEAQRGPQQVVKAVFPELAPSP